MQYLNVPISRENQLYIENVCTEQGYTLESFFSELIQDYKYRNDFEKVASQKNSLPKIGVKKEQKKKS